MELAVDGLQPLPVDVGVDLRGGDLGMAEHLLHVAEVGPSLHQMRGEGMADGVGEDAAVDARPLRPLLQDPPDADAGQLPALAADEDLLAGGVPASAVDIGAEEVDGPTSHGHDPLLGALAEDAEVARVEVEVGEAERGDLAGAEAAGVEQLDEGAIAEIETGGGLGVGEAANLIAGEGVGEEAGLLGGHDEAGQVVALDETQEDAHGGGGPGDAGRAAPGPPDAGEMVLDGFAGQGPAEAPEVAPVRQQGVLAQPALDLEMEEELLD